MGDRLIVAYLPEPHNHPLWSEIQRILDPKNEFGPIDPDDELVWIAFERDTLIAAATTLLYDTHAEIRLCGGSRAKDWIEDADALVTRWARDCGAPKITMRGRMGWARYFTRLGWAAFRTDDGKWLYEKVLIDGSHQEQPEQ